VIVVIVVFRGVRRARVVTGSACFTRRFDPLEHLTEIARRLALARFLAGVADQRAAGLRIRARMRAEKLGQGRVVREQFLPRLLDPVKLRRLGLVHAAIGIERRAQRRRFVVVERAHDPADILQLAPFAFVIGDAACCEHGIREVLRHRHALERVFRQLDQRGAERLQREHLALQLRFAGAIVAGLFVEAGIGRLDRLNTGFACHARHCSSTRLP